MGISAAWIPTRVVVVFALTALATDCSSVPQFTESDEQSNSQARLAPLVVVGLADSDVPIGRPIPSRRDPSYPMQLHRVRVKIENVLRGSISEQTIPVYYFGFAGGHEGPRPLRFGREPSRRILWLRRDRGAYRTACDGWDACTTFVMSGPHPRYRVDPHKAIDYALVDILLTRGEGKINDLQFASQIQSGVPDQEIQGYVIEKLRQLATTESSDIKSSACQLLWIYTQDQIESRLRQEAQDSLRVANCDCRLKPDGNVFCQ
jgi:hypothetical protein